MQKDYRWNPSTCICKSSKHLKHIIDDSAIWCDEITYAMEVVLTNITNTLATNAGSLCQ